MKLRREKKAQARLKARQDRASGKSGTKLPGSLNPRKGG